MEHKTIIKRFETRLEAEQFQNSLYDKYESVQLTSSPFFNENGVYMWKVY